MSEEIGFIPPEVKQESRKINREPVTQIVGTENTEYKMTYFGDTGLYFTRDKDEFAMHFMPINARNEQHEKKPLSRNEQYKNGLKFVYGLDSAVDWIKTTDSDLGDGVIRNSTNEDMNDFRKKIFEELEEATGIDSIYKYQKKKLDRGNLHSTRKKEVYSYELDTDKLVQAVDHLKANHTQVELQDLRYFKYLDKAKALWGE